MATVVKLGSFAVAANFDSAHETHEFVKCKIESLVANTVSDRPKEGTPLSLIRHGTTTYQYATNVMKGVAKACSVRSVTLLLQYYIVVSENYTACTQQLLCRLQL